MGASILSQWFSDSTIKAICWTLIHSLWIGLIIALLAGIVISMTRKSAAALRYRLLCAVLVLFVVAIGITYVIEANSTAPMTITKDHANVFINIVEAAHYNAPTAPASQSLLDRSKEFLNQNMSIIFMIWLLFFTLKSLKMAGGLLYIRRIRSYKTHAVTEELKHKVEHFSSQIGIRRAVRLVQSELVKVPVAVGWLKPVILLPLGIALQLTPEQLDGILWHELAHIRRRDYLINILQGMVETVFFFNPGLLWLSSLIRTEREACCDDMVLSRMNRKANYLEALLSFGYGEFKQTGLAMSLGSGNQLRDRLKRMISQENKRLNAAEKSVLAVGLILLLMLNVLPKASAITGRIVLPLKKAVSTLTSNPKFAKSTDSTNQNNEKQLRPKSLFAKDTIAVLRSDTSTTFVSVLFKNSDADLTNNDISAMDDKGKKYHFIVAGNKLVAMDINGEAVKESDLPNYQFMITQIDVAVLEKRHIRETDIARFKANQPNVKFKADRGFDKKRYVDSKAGGDSLYNADLQKMREIIADLAVRKVVPDADAVKWFALTDNEFIVNGQKQSNELQQRYKSKYGVHEGYGLYYGPAPMLGKGVFIDPEGMSKALHTRDSIQSERLFKTRYGMDDERWALKMQMMSRRMHDDSINYQRELKRMQDIIADLVRDKVVVNADAVKWFGLSNTEFIVNGQKQPDQMQQRYKAKYGVHEGWGLYYGPVQMTGRGVFIDMTAGSPDRMAHPPHPMRPERPGPKSTGDLRPFNGDTIAWRNQQLILQQTRFAADQNEKRAQLMQQQQAFAKDQNDKRALLFQQQQALLAGQTEKARRLWLKWDIDLQPAISGVIADLVSANVIRDQSELTSFILTNSAFIVNGNKLPEEFHQRLKAKYLQRSAYPGNGDGMDWNRIKDDPNFGLHFDTSGSEGLGITGKRSSQ